MSASTPLQGSTGNGAIIFADGGETSTLPV